MPCTSVVTQQVQRKHDGLYIKAVLSQPSELAVIFRHEISNEILFLRHLREVKTEHELFVETVPIGKFLVELVPLGVQNG